jgi:formylglycine-generating enzyme required for sulfatase activity
MGLLPIGEDPDSRLWEFAHLATGEPAIRGADGRLVLAESTGVVLVLIPHGTFWMGAQSLDPVGRNYDPQAMAEESPVHEVELSAYFLSKYEMTQGQWERIAGKNPSLYGPSRYKRDWNRAGKPWSALHPVEQVSVDDCAEVLARVGLTFPSEAQWENAARAGTSTRWWTGSDVASLNGAANLADAYAKSHGSASLLAWEQDLDDGNLSHAEIGSYRANAFGLHDVIGNEWEWCADDFDAEFYSRSPRTDPVARTSSPGNRITRGGSFLDVPEFARSAYRARGSPVVRLAGLGIRPAMALQLPTSVSNR